MKVKTLLTAGVLLIGVGASAASIDIRDPRFRPIMQFYEDCTFVAENCPQPQIRSVLFMIQEKVKPDYGLLDLKEKRIYAAIDKTHGMILQPDPGIEGLFPTSSMAYAFRIVSAKVLAASATTATIEVTRESVGMTNQPLKPRDPAYASGRSDTRDRWVEVDEWIKVDGAWKVRMVRCVLV
jgi:hypothetical protein